MTEQKPDSNLKERTTESGLKVNPQRHWRRKYSAKKRWLTFIQYVKSVIEQIMEEIEASRTGVEGKWEREEESFSQG